MQGQSEELGDLRARGWKNRFVGTRRQINNSREGWKNLRRRKAKSGWYSGWFIWKMASQFKTPNPKKIQFTSSKSRKLAAMLVTGEVTNKKWAGSWIKGTLGWMGKKSRSQSWGGTWMYCVCSQRHHQWFCLHHLTTLLHTIQAVLPSLARNSCYFGLGLVYLRGDCLVSTRLSGLVGAMLALASFTQQTMLTGWGSVASLSHPSDVLCLSWLQVSQPYKHHIYIMTNMGHEVSSMITNMLIEHRSMAMSAIHRMAKQYDRADPWLPAQTSAPPGSVRLTSERAATDLLV